MKNYLQWNHIEEKYKFEVVYRIKNKFEFDELIKKLKSEGYDTLFSDEYTDYYQVVWLHVDDENGDKFATASDMEFYNNYYDFWKEQSKPELIDYDLKYRKITMKEDDPFGEEDWGYEKIEEQEKYKFIKGERIRAKTKTGYSHILGCDGEGIVRDALSFGLGILWDNGFMEFCMIEEIEPLNVGKKRILKPEEDPFGEENWGFVQESNNLTVDDFKIGDIVDINYEGAVLMHSRIGLSLEDYMRERSGGKITSISNMDTDFPIYVKWPNGDRSSYRVEHFQFSKKMKKISNPEIDPFGEENWGFVQESNDEDVGEHMINLMEVYEKFNQDRKKVSKYLTDLLKGKIAKFRYYDENEEEYIYSNGEEIIEKVDLPTHYVFKCVSGKIYKRISLKEPVIYYDEKMKAKKLNLEDDPFGEENWGYLSEQKKEYLTFKDLTFEDFPGIPNSIRTKIKFDNGYLISIIKGPKFRCDDNTYELWVKDPNGQWDEDTSNYQTEEDITKLMLSLQKEKKRKLNLKDDPFGEENWGYVQESVIFGDLKIGDRVYTEDRKILSTRATYTEDKSGKRIYVGTIIKLKPETYHIYVMWDGGDYPSCHSINYITLYDKEKKRKLNLEYDPFGEENWGYVEESVKFNSLKIGDRVYTEDTRILPGHAQYIVDENKRRIYLGTIKGLNQNRVFVLWDGTNSLSAHSTKYITLYNKEENIEKEEENKWWLEESLEYIQESSKKSLRVGDTVQLIIGTQPIGEIIQKSAERYKSYARFRVLFDNGEDKWVNSIFLKKYSENIEKEKEEENKWWLEEQVKYTKENKKEEFEIGDIVRLKVGHQPFPYGKIIQKSSLSYDFDRILVRFDNGENKWVNSTFLKKYSEDIEKEEENKWWLEENLEYVQESLSKNLKVGDIVYSLHGDQLFGEITQIANGPLFNVTKVRVRFDDGERWVKPSTIVKVSDSVISKRNLEKEQEDRKWWLEEQVKYDFDTKSFFPKKKYEEMGEGVIPRYQLQIRFLEFLKKELCDNFVVFVAFEEHGFSTLVKEIKQIEIVRGQMRFIDVDNIKYHVKADAKISYYPKNIKKITNSELDPFDEEDWGYEEI